MHARNETGLGVLLERGRLDWEWDLQQTDNLSGGKSEVVWRILLSEILPLDVDRLREGNGVGLDEKQLGSVAVKMGSVVHTPNSGSLENGTSHISR